MKPVGILLRPWAAQIALIAFVAASAAQSVAAAEESVRPGANEKFLSPDLDVATWTKRFETESREIFRSRQRIVAALGLAPGMAVADVGAGTGLFVGPFAREVGAGGSVYAVEVSPKFLAHLAERVKREGLAQVQVVHSREGSVELPESSIDVAFLCDVYHHFEYPRSMLKSIQRALKPGGALVVVDFERIPGASSDWVLEHVRAGKTETRNEIEAADFVFERELAVEGLSENYLLRFRAP